MAEVGREGDRLATHPAVVLERDEEQQAEVVAHIRVDAVVVEEVAEVVEHAARRAVRDVRGVPGDQVRARLHQHRGSGAHVPDRAAGHVRAPMNQAHERVGAPV